MFILVGPSEKVDMESFAVGEIPFTTVLADSSLLIEGGAPLKFDQQIYAAEWGTYTVNFDADVEVSGVCISNED